MSKSRPIKLEVQVICFDSHLKQFFFTKQYLEIRKCDQRQQSELKNLLILEIFVAKKLCEMKKNFYLKTSLTTFYFFINGPPL